jgi:hypothetical protein
MMKVGLYSVIVGACLLVGCGHHYRQHQQAEFERRVADRCVEAASRPTQVVIVPAATATVAPTTP